MNTYFFDERSTKETIIRLLKKSGGMTIEELSRNVNITPMGIRQHLLSLEKKGFVTFIAKKHGIGRPGFVYMLTAKAEDFFPVAYDQFAIELLRDIKKYEGAEKIDKIFDWRRHRLYRLKKDAIANARTTIEILERLKQLLESNGHLIDITSRDGNYYFKQYHCPMSKIAREFKEACKYELILYRDLIGPSVTRKQTLSSGDPSCLYIIPVV